MLIDLLGSIDKIYIAYGATIDIKWIHIINQHTYSAIKKEIA